MRHKQAKPPCQALALVNLLTLIISSAQLIFCPLVPTQDTPHTSATLHISCLFDIQEQRQPGITSGNIVLLFGNVICSNTSITRKGTMTFTNLHPIDRCPLTANRDEARSWTTLSNVPDTSRENMFMSCLDASQHLRDQPFF